MRRKKKPVSPDEFEAILRALVRRPLYRLAARLMYQCGLEIDEVVNIRVGDVDESRLRLFGERPREVQLSERLANSIIAKGARLSPGDRIFSTPGPGLVPLSGNSFRAILGEAGATPAELREGYIFNRLQAGASIAELGREMGLKNPDPVRRLARLVEEVRIVAPAPALRKFETAGRGDGD